MKLDTEDRRQVDDICGRLLAQALSTDQIDVGRCRELVAQGYAFQKRKPPEILVFSSPTAAMAHLLTFSPDAGKKPRAAPAAAEGRVSFFGILKTVVSAWPKTWPGLGREVDLSFHPEVMDALDTIPLNSETWHAVKKRVESKVFDLCHLSHTVTETVAAQLKFESEGWLEYTQAYASLWAEATEYAALDAALALGYVASPPPSFVICRELLGCCSLVYSFEKLCIICERPAELQKVKNGRKTQTVLRWRDGSSRERVFE